MEKASQPPIKSPEVRGRNENGETLIFNWGNTCIRTFMDSGLNHIEYRDEDNQLRGIKIAQGLMDTLFELNFPHHFDPIPDEATEDWYIAISANELDDEIDGLLG